MDKTFPYLEDFRVQLYRNPRFMEAMTDFVSSPMGYGQHPCRRMRWAKLYICVKPAICKDTY